MILVIVGYQYIINGIRQINIREMVNTGVVSIITDKGVYEYTYIFGLNQNTGMSKITHPDLITGVALVRRCRILSKKRFKQFFLCRRNTQHCFYKTQALRHSFHFRELINTGMIKWNV